MASNLVGFITAVEVVLTTSILPSPGHFFGLVYASFTFTIVKTEDALLLLYTPFRLTTVKANGGRQAQKLVNFGFLRRFLEEFKKR